MMDDIKIIQILGTFFLLLIGFCFIILAKRVYDLEKDLYTLEQKLSIR
jgi:hypothetical protein